MAGNYNNQNQQNNFSTNRQQIRTNSRGEAEILLSATSVVNKKTGDVMPIFKTYIEIKGQLYKVELSTRRTETKNGLPGMWVKFTAKRKQIQQTAASSGF